MGGTWAGENHSFFRNLLLIIDPTFIPHRFGILDFRNKNLSAVGTSIVCFHGRPP